jgi:acyl dehydratase
VSPRSGGAACAFLCSTGGGDITGQNSPIGGGAFQARSEPQAGDAMTLKVFDTAIIEVDGSLVGPWRRPHQMLAAQEYDAHASIHDDATAQKLGFRGGTIEGPTHFSQFAPLCFRRWGPAWFETGCISARYRNPAFAGEEVQAILAGPEPGQGQCGIQLVKRDGTEVLRGTASAGRDAAPTALDRRLAELQPLADPVITRDIRVGMTTARQTVSMDFAQDMGALYPFSLNQKLDVITEPSPLYLSPAGNPWGRAIIPIEMLSVLFQYRSRDDHLPIRGPAVGLFADQEIRLLRGPLFVGEAYELQREVVALGGSRRTESIWLRTIVVSPGSADPVATMLLNIASIKESYARYADEYAVLYS